MLEVKTIDEVLEERKTTFLVFGNSGMGKTKFAGTFPGKKMWIELEEDGLASVAGEDIVAPAIAKFQDFEEFLSNIAQYHEKYKFETLVIDTMKGMQNMFFRDVIGKESKMNFDEWNKWSSKLVSTLTFLKQASKEGGFNVVYIAHQKNFTPVNDDGEHTEASWGADINTANSTKLHAMVDVAMKMETRKFPILNDKGMQVLNKKTGKMAFATEYIGIVAKSEGNQVKIRTTLKGITDAKGEVLFKDPTYNHFKAIKVLATKDEAKQTLENVLKVANKLNKK